MSLPDGLLDDCYLDHVAIVVEDLDKSQKIYEDLGLAFDDKREVVESQGVMTAFAPIDQRAHIELLCPHGEDGPIHQYLAKKGPGIHHLCFRVKDVVSRCAELREKGYRLIYDEPTAGANNCLINFIHPKSTGGVLIELAQKMDEEN
jgi:methylmalonyl-CoA epimerase